MKPRIKTIFITGASRGIGNGLAKELTRLGNIVLGTSRNQKIVDGITATYQLDINNPKSIKSVIEELNSKKIKIDLLINNAGIGSDIYEDLSHQDNFEIRFKTNFFNTYFFTEAILPLINKPGRIINVSSKLASFHAAHKIEKAKLTNTKMAYIISKSSLNMYTKLLANRLKEDKIEVISIHPGWVRTSLSNTNKNAPLSIGESVNGIIEILKKQRPSGSFWDAEHQSQIEW